MQIWRFAYETLGCLAGTIVFGLMAIGLSLAEVLRIPTLTKHGMPNRQTVAKYFLVTFMRWSLLCARSIFWLPSRRRLSYDLR